MPNIDYLLIAGGGGGGGASVNRGAGGGGGGGKVAGTLAQTTAASLSVVVGGGGTKGSAGGNGTNGGNSSATGLTTALGGGYGSSGASAGGGAAGGCGGGAGDAGGASAVGGTGSQGGNGGNNVGSGVGGSGGGAGGGALPANGANATTGTTAGAAGFTSSISGASTTYAKGGYSGASSGGQNGSPGDVNSGNGGDAGSGSGSGLATGGNGGSGVVIFRYLTSEFGVCLGGDKSTDGAYTVHKFRSSDTFVVVLPVLTCIGVTPSSGAGLAQTFVFQFGDDQGANRISQVWFWFTVNFSASSVSSFLCYWNRATNLVNFLDDAGTAYSTGALGAALVLQNSQGALDLAASSKSEVGTTMTVTLAVTFKPAYKGLKEMWMYANQDTVNTGWQLRGTWTVAPGLGRMFQVF